MFGKLFNKKNKITWTTPLVGTVKNITEAPDPAFSQKMMGDGICIDPTVGKVFSPVKGEIVSIFPTKHAIGIKDEKGHEILIHVGIDTVALNGEGFDIHVETGAKVEAGELLLDFDIENIRKKVPSIVTAVVITNLEEKNIKGVNLGEVAQGDTITFEI